MGVEGYGGPIGIYGNGSVDGVLGGPSTLSGTGVKGNSTDGYGVWGNSSSSDGIHGLSWSGAGVAGTTTSGNGVYGDTAAASGNYAGYFVGNVGVTGTVFGANANLRMDDPLDPAHKYLQHSSVASSDMMDMYNGNVRTDAKGFATVRMPRWFQALNRTFRYQLTIVGTRGWNARVVREITHNRFTIQTDRPRVKVSWQVTGIRHDRFANANRIKVVLPKPKAEQGKYLHPQLYGKPQSQAIGYRKPPRLPQRPSREH